MTTAIRRLSTSGTSIRGGRSGYVLSRTWSRPCDRRWSRRAMRCGKRRRRIVAGSMSRGSRLSPSFRQRGVHATRMGRLVEGQRHRCDQSRGLRRRRQPRTTVSCPWRPRCDRRRTLISCPIRRTSCASSQTWPPRYLPPGIDRRGRSRGRRIGMMISRGTMPTTTRRGGIGGGRGRRVLVRSDREIADDCNDRVGVDRWTTRR